MYSLSITIRRLTRATLGKLSPEVDRTLQLSRYAKSWILPRPCPADEPFVPSRMLGHLGFELFVPDQLATLKRWQDDSYQRLFQRLRQNPSINTGCRGMTFGQEALHNNYYPTPDAEIYAATILDAQPEEVLEVGSGYSTLIAREAIRYGGLKTRLSVIDMQPRTNVAAAADNVTLSFVEDTDLTKRDWNPNSILFIDSSHVCRARGDLPLLFCQVLPNLPAGMLVHVHDIFLPYDYPTNYDDLCYTEQYLLHCLLSGSPRYRTTMATHYLSRNHSGAMQNTFGPRSGNDPLFSGASYWFKVED